MSVKISSYVWDGCAAHGVKGTKLLVMLRLADFSNDEGVCYPGIAKIARQIAAGRSTVTGAIGELENDGWLTRKERRKGQRNDSNIYTLNVAKLKAAALSADSHSPDTDKSESDHSKSDTSGSERSESGKNEAFDPPESGYDPSVNSKQDPSVLKPVGQLAAPADEPQEDSLKIDYEAVKKIFHDTLPELPQVLKVTEARRKVLRKLWKEYDLNIEKWGAYLRYIAKKCRWMLEDRPDTTSGKTWRKKDFDYLITEKCYLSVKEERANDLPKVERLDTTARDDAYLRIVTQRRKPRNEVETIAQRLAGSLGRMTDYDARKAWVGIWANAVAQASENDLGRLAG